MIKIAIVEDEAMYAKQLEEFLHQYEKENGEQPAKEFMLSLDKKLRAKLADTIMILQDNGYELREPYSKHISEGIFELRAKQGSDITRVMYFFYVDRHIILTNGFIKKTQKFVLLVLINFNCMLYKLT